MLPKYMPKTLTICLAAALLVGTALPVPPARPASPDTFTVCATGCDFTTIQAALDDDRVTVGDTIQVMDPVHTEAGITVRKDVTIQGQGADKTIVQAHAEVEKAPARVFLIPEGVTATLRDMMIRHGQPGARDECGGGIMNYGALTLQSCIVTNNAAIGGGGVDNRGGTLMIVASTISDNVARGDGPPGIECGGGGGVKSSAGILKIVNSTITGNQAGLRSEGLGGGIRTGCQCTAEIVNSTISGNKAVRWGGGVAAAGTVQITNCTISNNAVGGGGGALWVRGEVSLENTIIANNVRGKDCTIGGEGGHVGTGSIVANTNNLIGDGSCNADFTGDPLLGPLADNGGATWTHALLPGSPAIDVVPAISCTLTTDQRGQPRPVACIFPDTPGDLGAFEVQADEYIPPTPTSTAAPTATSTPRPPTATPVPATPTQGASAASVALDAPMLLGLGLLLLGLVGLVVVWLWRRGS